MIRVIILEVIALLIATASLSAARETVDFNDDWHFMLTTDSVTAFALQTDDSAWRALRLPHDWSIEFDFNRDAPAGTGGGALQGGTGWYRKHFTVSDADKEKKVFIEFDGVYCNSRVWLNGRLLGFRPNGYVSFRYELTPYLKFNTDNLLVVEVDNSKQPNSRWYSGSGIYRNVRLVKTNDVYVDLWGTYITTPIISNEKAGINIKTTLYNQGKNDTVELVTILRDPSGEKVAQTATTYSFRDEKQVVLTQELEVDQPQLWNLEQPNLYTAFTEVRKDGQVVDNYETTFGIRFFRWEPLTGFYLNGEATKILGVCLHHDLGCLGTAVNGRALERQLRIMKDMGVNSIRTSHNPPAPELLDICDRIGLLVQDESFDMWRRRKSRFDYSGFFDEWYRRDLTAQVLRDRNHPSVFMWSIGNEVLEQWTDANADTLSLDEANLILNAGHVTPQPVLSGATLSVQSLVTSTLASIVRDLDSTRVITSGNNNTEKTNHLFLSGAIDVYGFNYHESDFEPFPENFPEKALIVSESTSGLMSRGIYEMPADSIIIRPERWDRRLDRPLHICSAYDNCHVPWGSTHEVSWREVKRLPHVAGLFVWTGFDYLGEPTPYGWPSRSSFFGIVDLAGFPKDVYYMYQSEWTEKPVLHIFPHWNWNEGQEVDVWAYYNQADEVELFLNGETLGVRSKNDTTFHVAWKVPFHPGVLKAISRKNGCEVLSEEIHTAGEAARVTLKPDRDKIGADGADLSFVTVEIQDSNGNLSPEAGHLIQFSIEGPGFIAGTDNGNQNDTVSLKKPERHAFGGKAIAVVQSHKSPGTIRLKAIADQLPEVFIEIKSE
jgi:beta-galactosidase